MSIRYDAARKPRICRHVAVVQSPSVASVAKGSGGYRLVREASASRLPPRGPSRRLRTHAQENAPGGKAQGGGLATTLFSSFLGRSNLRGRKYPVAPERECAGEILRDTTSRLRGSGDAARVARPAYCGASDSVAFRGARPSNDGAAGTRVGSQDLRRQRSARRAKTRRFESACPSREGPPGVTSAPKAGAARARHVAWSGAKWASFAYAPLRPRSGTGICEGANDEPGPAGTITRLSLSLAFHASSS